MQDQLEKSQRTFKILAPPTPDLCALREPIARMILEVRGRLIPVDGSRLPDVSRCMQKLNHCPDRWFDGHFDRHSALNVREPLDAIMVGDIASMALNLLDRYTCDLDHIDEDQVKLAAIASLSLALKYHDDDLLNTVRLEC
jgi:hypothetical protein